jgi:hypothetical protein
METSGSSLSFSCPESCGGGFGALVMVPVTFSMHGTEWWRLMCNNLITVVSEIDDFFRKNLFVISD